MRTKAKQNLGFVAWVRSTYAPNDAQKALTAFEALASAANESVPARLRTSLKGAERSLGKRLSKRTAAVYASRFRTAFDRWVDANNGHVDDSIAPEELPRIDARSDVEHHEMLSKVELADPVGISKYVDPRKAIEPVEETAPIEGDVLLQAAQLLDESNRWPALQPYLVPFVANLIRKSRG